MLVGGGKRKVFKEQCLAPDGKFTVPVGPAVAYEGLSLSTEEPSVGWKQRVLMVCLNNSCVLGQLKF